MTILDKLLTAEETAAELSVSKHTLARWRQIGADHASRKSVRSCAIAYPTSLSTSRLTYGIKREGGSPMPDPTVCFHDAGSGLILLGVESSDSFGSEG